MREGLSQGFAVSNYLGKGVVGGLPAPLITSMHPVDTVLIRGREDSSATK